MTGEVDMKLKNLPPEFKYLEFWTNVSSAVAVYNTFLLRSVLCSLFLYYTTFLDDYISLLIDHVGRLIAQLQQQQQPQQ